MSLIILTGVSSASDLIDRLNSLSLAQQSRQFLGHQYDSHGCFHFYPSDIYLLHQLLPNYAQLTIRTYQEQPTASLVESLPFADEVITSSSELKDFRKRLANHRHTHVDAFPSARLWIVYDKTTPLFKVAALPGPYKAYNLAYGGVDSLQPGFDPSRSKQTTPGTYYFLGRDIDFYTPYYRDTTMVPMEAKIQKKKQGYVYYKNQAAHPLPKRIARDLEENYQGAFLYNYFSIKRDKEGRVTEAYWGSHDFGKYVIFWSRDKKHVLNEMGYASGEVYFEQLQFIRDLADALGSDELPSREAFLSHFHDYETFKKLQSFLAGSSDFFLTSPAVTTYLKLHYNLPLSYDEWHQMPPHLRAAYKLYYFPDACPLEEDEQTALDDMGLSPSSPAKIYGLERELYLYKIATDKVLYKFRFLSEEWDTFRELHDLLGQHFAGSKYSQEQRRDKIHVLLRQRYMLQPLRPGDLKL